ncbi:MAG: thiamine-phosphate kinase [Deltaproteobacteria bacterium]|nr:thiamine-phosphate kinase [Deltaproteobacteria bacterium]
MFLKKLGEEEIIRSLAERFSRKHPRLIKGIGDDTSVTFQRGDKVQLATTDILIEDTHFRLSYTPPYFLGRKSLNISVSDIAAMGGAALFFLVSIALPENTTKGFLDELYRGIDDAARECGAILAGGNTARTEGKMMVSTTVLGEAQKDKVVYRSGARPGDIIYVTGTLGDSALGLKALKSHGKDAIKKGPFKNAVLRHLDPAPRVEAGDQLAKKKLASAMMDISDGLALDLKRLCLESKAAAIIELYKLPTSADFRKFSGISKNALLNLALSGGEDYELLFTSPEENSKKIASLSKKLKLPITPIGRITPLKDKNKVITVIDEHGLPIKVEKLGFEHF